MSRLEVVDEKLLNGTGSSGTGIGVRVLAVSVQNVVTTTGNHVEVDVGHDVFLRGGILDAVDESLRAELTVHLVCPPGENNLVAPSKVLWDVVEGIVEFEEQSSTTCIVIDTW